MRVSTLVKKLVALVGFVLCQSVFAEVILRWEFNQSSVTASPTDTIDMNATVYSDPSSTNSYTIKATGFGFNRGTLIGNWYAFPNFYSGTNPYFLTDASSQNNMQASFSQLTLAPGESASFRWGTIIPSSGSVTPGTYSLDSAGVSFGDNWDFILSQNKFSVTVPSSPAIAPFSSYRTLTHLAQYGLESGGYGASFDGQNFVLDVGIGLIGDVLPDDVRQIWEDGIESFWGNEVTLSDGVNSYPLLVDVSFSTNTSDADYILNIRDDYCRSYVATISEWCLRPMTDDSGQPDLNMRDEVAIHEFGHMLGLYDEYLGSGNDPLADPDDLCQYRTFFGVPIPGTPPTVPFATA